MTILGIGSAGLVYSRVWQSVSQSLSLWSCARCEGTGLTVTEGTGGENDIEVTKIEEKSDLNSEEFSLSDLIELIKPDIGWLIVAMGVNWVVSHVSLSNCLLSHCTCT